MGQLSNQLVQIYLWDFSLLHKELPMQLHFNKLFVMPVIDLLVIMGIGGTGNLHDVLLDR
eukprot:211319-Ditylum_brightwellii.AAC.1